MSVQAALRAGSRPRPLGFLAVTAFHVALVWLVANGLGLRLSLEPPSPPIEATFHDEHRPIVGPPPLPPAPTPRTIDSIDVDPPEIPLPIESPPPADTITATGVESPGGTAGVEPRREPASTDPRHPLAQPPYPAASIRFGEEGSVTLDLRVGADGRVREARVRNSSGFPRLDAAALEEALRVWRLRPATVDDAPVEAWHSVRVSFRLDRR